LAAGLAQERADRYRQFFSNENLSSSANQTDVSDGPFGKTSPYASGPRTTQIMDGKVVSCLPAKRKGQNTNLALTTAYQKG
jgi:hypothetical protein